MSKATAETEARVPGAVHAELRPDLQQIISDGQRKAPAGQGSLKSVALLSGVSLILLWMAFTPLQLGAVAWLALVPVIQLIRLKSLPLRATWMLWLLGTVWALGTLQWMRLGHPSMYGALFALALYVGLYLPIFVRVSRAVISSGIPLWIAVPVVWCSLEFARAHLLTGFSWYYLGHSQYQWRSLTQISDVTGAYGVSFVVALASSAIAVQVPASWLKFLRLDADCEHAGGRLAAPVAAVMLLTAACAYGEVQLRSERPARQGPVFALIQGNFTPDEKHSDASIVRRYRRHEELTFHAKDLQPDFIVWPETMFPWPMCVVADGVTDDELLDSLPAQSKSRPGSTPESLLSFWRNNEVVANLADQSQIAGAAMIVGLETSVASQRGLSVYNSAAFIRPDLGYIGRYDKMHLVMFGEYIPLKSIFPWLEAFSPYGSGFGFQSGKSPRLFEYDGFTVAPLICFEDTVPQLTRRIVNHVEDGVGHCDVLVNLTNDAWFHGSSELDQHLITAAFRCIETRTPMVRAVNGGISAFIDSDGQIREPDQILVVEDEEAVVGSALQPVEGMKDPKTGQWRRQFNGIVLGQVLLDDRSSIYLRFGDWFCWLCSGVTVAAAFVGWRRGRQSAARDQDSDLS
jgi:apolipoprotein N-acyltransferase